MKKFLFLALVVTLSWPARAQFGSSGGFGGGFDGQRQPPPVVQTPAQMADDSRALGFVVPGRHFAYRNVDVILATSWGGAPTLVKTRGWIVPDVQSALPTFIAWNGWKYRAQNVGSEADWRRDARALLERASRDYPISRPYRGSAFAASPVPATWRFERNASDDLVSLSFDALSPLKAVMLESLGEPQLAKEALAIIKAQDKKERAGWDEAHASDALYRFEFAGDWIWPGMNGVDRAISSGDDKSALELLRLLMRAFDVMKGRGGMQSSAWSWQPTAGYVAPLLRDWTRRGFDSPPADKNSVAFVVWDLQNVGLPGKANALFQRRNDPRIARAIAYGDRAVESLLDAMENDQRLTRGSYSSGNFGGNGGPNRIFKPVSEVAMWALEEILQNPYSDDLWKIESDIRDARYRANPRATPAPYDELMADARRQLAKTIRADWNKWRAVSPAERPYLILKDDEAGAGKWRSAAHATSSG